MLPFSGDKELVQARLVRGLALLLALMTCAGSRAATNQQSSIVLPETVLEGSGPHTALVRLAHAPGGDLTLNLGSSPTGQLSLPATVTVSAGQTSAEFTFSVLDDDLVNLERYVSVNATAPGVEAEWGGTNIYDDDAPVPTLTVPAQLPENGSASTPNATLTIDRPAPRSLSFWLSSDPATLAHPYNVTIPAGQTQVAFITYGWNNDYVDGDLLVTVRANSTGLATASASLVLTDNEARTLSVTLPSSIQENSSGTGTISLTGKTRAPLAVSLSSSNPSAANVPLSATIPAGASFVTFPVNPINNSVRDGSRAITITPQANTFISVPGTTHVRDDEVTAYQITPPGDVVDSGAPVPIALSAVDSEGRPVSGLSHSVELFLVFADGSTQPASPPSVTLNGAVTNVNFSVPPSVRPPFRIRARDANGVRGESQMLDTIRFVNVTAADLVWDATRNRIYASIPSSASGPYANHVVAIDPATAQITAAVLTGQNPTRLALTSGGEALYAGLNGNGTLARINPDSMTIVSSFSLGNVNGYALQARDICPIPGNPGSIIVARGSSASSEAIYPAAIFDNGVQRTATVPLRGIEPSPDPTLFFGDSTEGGVSHVRADINGLHSIAFQKFGLAGAEIVADGAAIFSTWNFIDGANLKFVGSFFSDTSRNFRAVRPELARHRVYLAEFSPGSSGTISYLTAYDPATFLPIRRATIPPMDSAQSLIRWGTDGLAFRARHNFTEKVAIVNASQLVPVDAPANLSVALEAVPNAATASNPITYRVNITNQGPNVARTAFVTATLSDGQLIENVEASSGTPSVSGYVVKLPIGDLPGGASVLLTITATPQGSRRSVSCSVDAWTSSVDPISSDNVASTIVPVGFSSAQNAVNQLRLTVNNIAYDESRDRLWATIPATVAAPFGRSLVAIDPVTGDVSTPIPLRGNPTANCMVLSRNGRYLYVGLTDVPEVHRVDLDSPAYESLRIPLGLEQGGSSATYARDIEALEGDGTSFIISTTWDHAAAVYDGEVRRPTRTGGVVAQRLERTATANIFVSSASSSLSRLLVSPSGVSVGASASQLVGSSSTFEMRSSGDLVLSSFGGLIDSSTLTRKADLGLYGRPCLDAPNRRAYIVSGTALHAFDPFTTNSVGNLPLPETPSDAFGDWAQSCIRWGADGFAIVGPNKIYLARWSGAIPADVDLDGDRIADAWEAAHFGTLELDASADGDRDGLTNAFEYFFASSPVQGNGTALRTRVTRANGETFLHLMYPRRQQRIAGSYAYDVSTDLATWEPAQNVTETIVGTTVLGGVQVELIDAAIPAPSEFAAFARLRWLSP